MSCVWNENRTTISEVRNRNSDDCATEALRYISVGTFLPAFKNTRTKQHGGGDPYTYHFELWLVMVVLDMLSV